MEANTGKPAPTDHRRVASLAVAAIGVVYGDIGTSPLYTIQECFNSEHGLDVTHANVLGIASLVLWALIIVVTLKYVLFVMRADNRGEGGILALLALVSQRRRRRQARRRHGADAGARPVRRGAVLRRRHDHSGHFGAVGGRGHGRRHPGPARRGGAGHPGGAGRPVLVQSHGTAKIGGVVRAGDGGVVPHHRRARACARSSAIRPSCAARRPARTAVRFLFHHGWTVFSVLGVGGAGGDRRRGALRRHGPFRQAADPAGVVLPGAAGAGAQLFRPGRRCCWRDPEAVAQPVLPDGAVLGRWCRWCCWPPPPPSSPARR